MGGEDFFRDSGCFLAEDQKVVHPIGGFCMGPGGFGRAEVESVSLILLPDLLKVFMVVNLYQMPVIKACPFQMPVVYGKAQGLYQMKLDARAGAESCYISCIAGNFRLNQYDVHDQSAFTTAPVLAEVVSFA